MNQIPRGQIKIIRRGVLSALSILAFVLSGAENAQEPTAETSVGADRKLVETWGWVVAQENGVAGIEINAGELAGFMKGFSAGLRAEPLSADFQKIRPDVERLAKDRRKKLVRAIEQQNEAQAEPFFEELKKKPGAIVLAEGVRCEIIAPGRGDFPKLGQTVNVHYTARLIDGTEFMQSGPIDLVLVTSRRVCRGWTDALQRLRKGGAMKLYVPPPLPEAEARDWGIEPGSAMIFEIELLDIKDTAPDALASSLAQPPPDEPPAPSGFSELKIMEAWGWSVAQRTGIAALGLTPAECSFVADGVSEGIKGRAAVADLEQIYPRLEKFVADRREGAARAARQKRRDESDALFAELKKNPAVVALADGLRYEILKPGKGAAPKTGQIVLVDYTGRLVDGTVFDRTDNEPLNVEVGSVIRGWNEGIQRIGVGGSIKLYIPPELGYKDTSISGHIAPIPPGSTLIYEIELLEIKDTLPGR
jgi:FKBP-type peptidyl-prolyl cis-trans isomerase